MLLETSKQFWGTLAKVENLSQQFHIAMHHRWFRKYWQLSNIIKFRKSQPIKWFQNIDEHNLTLILPLKFHFMEKERTKNTETAWSVKIFLGHRINWKHHALNCFLCCQTKAAMIHKMYLEVRPYNTGFLNFVILAWLNFCPMFFIQLKGTGTDKKLQHIFNNQATSDNINQCFSTFFASWTTLCNKKILGNIKQNFIITIMMFSSVLALLIY